MSISFDSLFIDDYARSKNCYLIDVAKQYRNTCNKRENIVERVISNWFTTFSNSMNFKMNIEDRTTGRETVAILHLRSSR